MFPRLRSRANATRARGGSADPPGAKASARGNLPGSGSTAERGSTTSRPLHQPSASFFAPVFFQHLNISPFFRIKTAFARKLNPLGIEIMKTQCGCFENMCGLMAAAATAARWITVVVLCVSIRCAVGLRGACFHRQRGELVSYFCIAHTARRTCPIYCTSVCCRASRS